MKVLAAVLATIIIIFAFGEVISSNKLKIRFMIIPAVAATIWIEMCVFQLLL